MSTLYRILLLEDIESDAELIQAELRRADFGCICKWTDNETDFKQLVHDFSPDIVLSDYSMPAYDGMAAVQYVAETSPFTPVIIVTGSINEETAVACMKAGAVDYILKDKLKRLGPAVTIAIKAGRIRKEHDLLQQELVYREKYYRGILKYMHDEVVVISKDYIITDINNSELKLLGKKRENIIGQHCYTVLYGYDSPCPEYGKECYHPHLFATGEKVRYQRRTTGTDGTQKTVDILISPLFDEQHAVARAIVSFRDITDFVQAKESLIKLSLAVEQNPTGIILMDLSGKVEYVNAAFSAISGYTKEEILGKSMDILTCGDFTQQEREKLRNESTNGITKKQVFHNRRKDGSEYWVASQFAPFTNTEGELAGYVEVQEDITESLENRKKIENNLKEKQLLLHEVYHRVNNNLQIIISLLNMQQNLANTPAEVDILRTAKNRLETMAIIENSIYGEENFNQIRVGDIITAIFDMLRDSYSIPYGAISFTKEITVEGLALTHAQPVSLVVHELLSNCMRHAFPHGRGTINLTLGKQDSTGYILEVTDDGKGLPPDIDPKESKSTGFNLVYLLGEGQLGGKVLITSDKGTRVTLTFPDGRAPPKVDTVHTGV